MPLGDSIPGLVAFALVEAFFLQRTVFADETLRTVLLGALGVNVVVMVVYTLIIWPLFLSPLRHLPTVPVRQSPRRPGN